MQIIPFMTVRKLFLTTPPPTSDKPLYRLASATNAPVNNLNFIPKSCTPTFWVKFVEMNGFSRVETNYAFSTSVQPFAKECVLKWIKHITINHKSFSFFNKKTFKCVVFVCLLGCTM